MKDSDLQRIGHIRKYKEVIWETATRDIPVLLRFCEGVIQEGCK